MLFFTQRERKKDYNRLFVLADRDCGGSYRY
jgi:hypothetical protein